MFSCFIRAIAYFSSLFILVWIYQILDFPGGSDGKESTWVQEVSWRRKWLLTLVYLHGESPWTEEPGGLQCMGLQRAGHNTHKYTKFYWFISWWIPQFLVIVITAGLNAIAQFVCMCVCVCVQRCISVCLRSEISGPVYLKKNIEWMHSSTRVCRFILYINKFS